MPARRRGNRGGQLPLLLLLLGHQCQDLFVTGWGIPPPLQFSRVALEEATRPPPPEIQEALQEQAWRQGIEPGQEVGPIRLGGRVIKGSVPPELQGTLFRNGPGRVRIGSHVYGHWFDGDGFVSAVTIKDGDVVFRQKFVRGHKFLDQEATGPNTIGPRGVWTQSQLSHKNFFRIPENPINTNVMALGNKAYALCEGGPLFEIDPCTLDLKSPFTFDGRMKGFFSAHPKFDPDTGDIYNHGVRLGISNKITAMKYSPKTGSFEQNIVDMGDLHTVHDSVLTSRYLIVFISPYMVAMDRLLSSIAGFSSLGSCHSWDGSKPTRVLAFDRQTLKLVSETLIPPVSLYHFVAGYDDEGDDPDRPVVLYVAKHRSDREAVESQFHNMYKASFDADKVCEVWKYVVDVKNTKLISQGPLTESHKSYGFELPSINPLMIGKKVRYAYVNSLVHGGGLADSTSKVDLERGGLFETHNFGPRRYGGEAIFVPRDKPQSEDDGYLLIMVYDADRGASDLVVLDARKIQDPPVCTIELPLRVPFGFHGCWTPNTYGLL